MEIVSIKQAKQQGLKFFFTGKRCRKGHLAPRRVGCRHCVICERIKLNNDQFRKYQTSWRVNNRDRVNKAGILRDQKRRPYKIENVRARKAGLDRATPKWADRDVTRAYYEEAADRTRQTGIRWVVDHIEPLRGKDRCGLHVGENLRVITETENLAKGNRPLEHGRSAF